MMKRRITLGILAIAMVAAGSIGFGAPAEARHHGYRAPIGYGYWDGFAYRPDLPGAQAIYGLNPYVPNSSYYNNYYGNNWNNRWLNRRSYNWWY